MRSTGLSTNVAKTTPRLIFNYGLEALTNRRKELFFIAFIFIFLPQLTLSLAWAEVARVGVESLRELATKPPIVVLEGIIDLLSEYVLSAGIGAFLLGLLGLLALARTSVDYFESRPSSFVDVVARAGRVLLTKGLGTFLFLAVLLPLLAILPLLRAIALSMLLMLPITLVVSHKGGFRTTWDTLFLKYGSLSRFGRWPIFFNVLTFSGIFLTLLFAFIMLIDFLKVIDTWLVIPAGLLEGEVQLFNYKIGWGEFITQILTLVWNTAWFAIAMPFAAATYHLSTMPEDHVNFEASA
jgi:hypothetical protein